MAKTQKLTTEEARKQFAELLNGSQFRSEHTEITRHGKAAGYLVPPEWYEAQQAGQGKNKALQAEVKALRKQIAELQATEVEPPVPEPNERPSPLLATPAPIAVPRPAAVPDGIDDRVLGLPVDAVLALDAQLRDADQPWHVAATKPVSVKWKPYRAVSLALAEGKLTEADLPAE